MEIIIKITKNFGTEAIYPVSDSAQVFARIAGTRTLTRDTLKYVEKLGYKITVQQEVLTP